MLQDKLGACVNGGLSVSLYHLSTHQEQAIAPAWDYRPMAVRKRVMPTGSDDTPVRKVTRARMLPTSDGRTIYAKLVSTTFEALIAHLGGEDAASVTQRIAARRIASLEAHIVHQECQFAELHAAGDTPSADALATYGMLADRQRRLCQSLGWRPTARDVTPDLSNYVQQPRSHYDDGDR